MSMPLNTWRIDVDIGVDAGIVCHAAEFGAFSPDDGSSMATTRQDTLVTVGPSGRQNVQDVPGEN